MSTVPEPVKEAFIDVARLQKRNDRPKRNQNPVSYLATWQHGNVKLMLYNARHIPGPDAHQWCNSGSATSVHAANQSSPAFSPPLRVTAFTSDAVSLSFPFFPSSGTKNPARRPSPKTMPWWEWTSKQCQEDYPSRRWLLALRRRKGYDM